MADLDALQSLGDKKTRMRTYFAEHAADEATTSLTCAQIVRIFKGGLPIVERDEFLRECFTVDIRQGGAPGPYRIQDRYNLRAAVLQVVEEAPGAEGPQTLALFEALGC